MIGVGIIGCGNISAAYLRLGPLFKGLEISAVADVNPAAAATRAAEFGVRANAIGPGVVNTPLTAPIKQNAAWYDAYAKRSALGRWAEPEEMVGAVIYLASQASSFVTGTIHFVDGGWTAIDGRFTPPL